MGAIYLILYAHALHSMVIITLPCIVLSFLSFLNLFLLCFCFLFLVGLWFLAFLVPFVSIFFYLQSSLSAFYTLWQSKRGRTLRIECHSSGGVINLGGELHVKRKKVFYVTNLGGVLVWYTLILIYFLCCVSFGFVTIYIHIFDDDVCVSPFISHVLFFRSLYICFLCI